MWYCRGLGTTEFYVLQRTEADIHTVPHVAAALSRWEANTDVSLVGSVHGTATYVCSYMTKAETDGIRSVVATALNNLPEDSSLYRKVIVLTLANQSYSINTQILSLISD